MKALLLAAGKGERLEAVTKMIPKPMVEIFGKPILEHNILMLKNAGIKDIFINLHHLPEIITDYFGDGTKWGVNIDYKYEEDLLGTSGAVKSFSDILTDQFVVVYADNLFDSQLSLDPMIAIHNENQSDFTMGLCEVDDISLSGTVELTESNKVTKLVEKPQTNGIISGWVNAGIYFVEPIILKKIKNGYSDFGYDVIPLLIEQNFNVYGYKIKKKVLYIDTPELLEKTINDKYKEEIK